MASIAHELQHALEVLSNPKVRSTLDMFVFFDRQGPVGWRDTFETDKALQVGMRQDGILTFAEFNSSSSAASGPRASSE